MTQIAFNTEITVEDKYREFDINPLVHANIIEERVLGGYAHELIVNIDAAEVDDKSDVSPYQNGDDLLSRLDDQTIEFLKDEAVKNYN